MASMSAFAMTSLGMDNGPARERVAAMGRTNTRVTTTSTTQQPTNTTSETRSSARASSKRATSNFNAFQTYHQPSSDSPPAYTLTTRQKPKTYPQPGREQLPQYTCTVSAEGKLLLQLESINPIHGACETYWRDAYVVLRGTLLCIYRVKDNRPGRMLKSYTLQHAEVGLATDTQHEILIPQTRLAHLIPSSARRKAFNRDPGLFKAVKQTILRIRAETDQFILADSSEDKIHEFVNALSASIDIAMPLDERSIPRQCTVPRRRRRPNAATALLSANLSDPALLAEQERILRDMYPSFAERVEASAAAKAAGGPSPGFNRSESEQSSNQTLAPTTTREEDDVDLSMIREESNEIDSAGRPSISRNTSITSTQPLLQQTPTSNPTATTATPSLTSPPPTDGSLYTPAPNHFTTTGKWNPPHTRSLASIQRYIRRCMPILPASAPRASDILICSGRRCKINWRTLTIERWDLKAPLYAAHNFELDRKQMERIRLGIPTVDMLQRELRDFQERKREAMIARGHGLELASRRLSGFGVLADEPAREFLDAVLMAQEDDVAFAAEMVRSQERLRRMEERLDLQREQQHEQEHGHENENEPEHENEPEPENEQQQQQAQQHHNPSRRSTSTRSTTSNSTATTSEDEIQPIDSSVSTLSPHQHQHQHSSHNDERSDLELKKTLSGTSSSGLSPVHQHHLSGGQGEGGVEVHHGVVYCF